MNRLEKESRGRQIRTAGKRRVGPRSKYCPRLSPAHRKILQGYGLNDLTINKRNPWQRFEGKQNKRTESDL